MFEFRDRQLMEKILRKIKEVKLELRFMHVCGTHQDTIIKYGLDNILKECDMEVRQGPGCPVCVTSTLEIEKAIHLAKNEITITSFGDMIRVPTSTGSLMDARGDAIEFAKKSSNKKVVFAAIGFETTAPSTASIIKEENMPENFSILSLHRYLPPALRALLNMGELRIDGIIEPGHVSTIIGLRPYEEISKEYNLPQVVAGFEPLDVMMGAYMLVRQILNKQAKVENEYSRTVKQDGNKKALELMSEVFEPSDVNWRGFQLIPKSKMKLKKEYEKYDAEVIYGDLLGRISEKEEYEPEGCKCSEVIRGLIEPNDCPLIGTKCTPQSPIGPCMVSFEGACNIEYKYRKASHLKK
jgi:hydrogenase expression/formation protein HypD